MTSVLAVVGPTATGKTSFGIELGQRLGTEIISADCMQFYRGMEIGTAAPTPEDMARVRHHFASFLDPRDHFSAGEFQRAARAIVGDLNARGKVAVVVGGSGLYVRALVDGLFSGPGRDRSVRKRLQEIADDKGVAALYARLEQLDPGYAQIISPNDLRRIVRALEVYEMTGLPLSVLHQQQRSAGGSVPAVLVAFDYPRADLYARINARVDRIIERGFIEEVRALLDKGYEEALARLRPLGYLEMAAHLRGELAFGEAVDLMKRNTRRFAKRQLTWFRADPRIRWFPLCGSDSPMRYVEAAVSLLDSAGPQ